MCRASSKWVGLLSARHVLHAHPLLTLRMSGSAGVAFPGVEVAIAEDGEILARGPNLFLGYYKVLCPSYYVGVLPNV